MTAEQFEEALHERGIETERDEQGIVTMLHSSLNWTSLYCLIPTVSQART